MPPKRSPFEWPVAISQLAVENPDKVDSQLLASSQAYQKHLQRLTSQGHTSVGAAKILQSEGYRVLGWNKGIINRALYPAANFKNPRMPSVPPSFDSGFVSRWNREALLERLSTGIRRGPHGTIPEAALFRSATERAGRFGLGEELLSKLGAEAPQGLIDMIRPPTLTQRAGRVGKSILGLSRGKKLGIGLGVGLVGLYALQPGRLFNEERNGAANPIEGLTHNGIAWQSRRRLTDFGSGYQGDDNSRNILISLGVAGSLGSMLSRRNSSLWVNAPMDVSHYRDTFSSFKYKAGDIIVSRNVMYDEPFHMAIVGRDKHVYQTYPGAGRQAKITRESIDKYIEGQLKIHGAEGMDYPLMGVLRPNDLSTKQRIQVSRSIRRAYKEAKTGKIKPSYGLRANRGLNEINCLSFIGEAHKEAGKHFFEPGSKMALPWNVQYGRLNWVLRGPEKVSFASFTKHAKLAGIGTFALGVATQDASTALQGGAILGAGLLSSKLAKGGLLDKLPLAGLLAPERYRRFVKPALLAAAYARITYPAIEKGVETLSGTTSEDIRKVKKISKESDIGTISKIGALGGLGLIGYSGFATLSSNKLTYDSLSKRVLILADPAAGTAKGHLTPAQAMGEWLGKNGWEADIVAENDAIAKLAKDKRKYRAFIDAGYTRPWVGGLPGIAVQWDVLSKENISSGKFRAHISKGMGIGAPGMAFVTPSDKSASLFSKAVNQSNFYGLETLTVKPGVLDKLETIRKNFAAGKVSLPNIRSGEKFVTISGGGKGFGVPETLRTLMESGWLKETGHKAVVFGAHLDKQRPEAYKALMELAKKDPSGVLVYGLEKGGPGYRLPEYMAGATANILVPGASTTVEAVAAQRPFVGVHGGGIPDWSHFIEHPKFAREKYGAIAESMRVPELSEPVSEAASSLRSKLESVIVESNRGVNRLPSHAEFDVGKKIIDIIERGEAAGQLKPVSFRASVSSLGIPLFHSAAFRKNALIGLGVVAGSLLMGSVFSGKDDAHNTIEGLSEKGMAGRLRKQNTDFGSGYRGILSISKVLEPLFAEAGIAAQSIGRKELGGFLKSTVTRSMKSGGVASTFTTQQRSLVNKELSNLMKSAETSAFDDVVLLNIGAMKKKAQEAGYSWGKYLKGTIRHERFHQALTQSGKRAELLSKVEVPGAFKKQLQKAYKSQGLKIDDMTLKEEFLAHSITAEYTGAKMGTWTQKDLFVLGRKYVANMESVLNRKFLPNTARIEGFAEQGLAAQTRKPHGFGSPKLLERIVGMARRIFKNPKAETAFEKLISPVEASKVEMIFGRETATFSPASIRSGAVDDFISSRRLAKNKVSPSPSGTGATSETDLWSIMDEQRPLMGTPERTAYDAAEKRIMDRMIDADIKQKAAAQRAQNRAKRLAQQSKLNTKANETIWRNAKNAGTGHKNMKPSEMPTGAF